MCWEYFKKAVGVRLELTSDWSLFTLRPTEDWFSAVRQSPTSNQRRYRIDLATISVLGAICSNELSKPALIKKR